MALYDLIVRQGPVDAAAVREVRKWSAAGISEITRRIRAGDPVITVSTTDYALEVDREQGHRQQHEKVLAAHAALSDLGCQVAIQYRASADSSGEAVTLDMAKNLMESELLYLRQEHD